MAASRLPLADALAAQLSPVVYAAALAAALWDADRA